MKINSLSEAKYGESSRVSLVGSLEVGICYIGDKSRIPILELAYEIGNKLSQSGINAPPCWIAEIIGDQIISLLRKHGTSFREIEREMGIPKSTVHRWARRIGENK